MLGGGGLVAANVYASATEDGSGGETGGQWPRAATIDCPDVGDRLTDVPDEARTDVDKDLAQLDQQTAEAYQRLQDPATAAQLSGDANAEGVMNPLKEDRAATIERIAAAIDRVGDRPEGLDTLAPCTLRKADNQAQGADAGQSQDGQQDGQNDGGQGDGGQADGGQADEGQQQGDGGQDQGEQQGNGGQAGNGPVAGDYVDITTIQPNAQAPQARSKASRGTFATSCGVNENGLFNSDNVIVAPGVSNGAHHFHDYVGNQSNTAFASDQDLANGETTCVDQGDKSTYYWPVVRLQNGTQEQDANSPGGGIEGNAGEIVTPKQVTLDFVGSPKSKVTAMPRFLRIITGDAKAFVNGTANANASWSCTGFEDRQLKDKYPLCPQGSDVVRTFKFQSCWDGRNIDSANHRTHVAFAQADGACPTGFQAIPQLVQRIVYDIDAPSLKDGGRTAPLFAVDSFPEQLHKPVTDHGDFINVFDEGLMKEMVDCINAGRKCGAGADQGDGGDQGPGNDPQEQPSATAKPTPDAPDTGNGDNGNAGNGEGQSGGKGDEQPEQPPADTPADNPTDTPADTPTDNGTPTGAGAEVPKAGTPAPDPSATTGSPQGQAIGEAVTSEAPSTAPPTTGAVAQPPLGAQTEPQGSGGSLAETGSQLWPAAAGAVLLIGGFVLLMRTRRGSAR
ncbi:DUF1996 domain-containing protein [Streptomyces lincolnensis]|uniref:DUF1996 domain-containing protein n=1 Tax=Streptomyces lincolnensis TaxID=1915 RepID=UPI0037CD5576